MRQMINTVGVQKRQHSITLLLLILDNKEKTIKENIENDMAWNCENKVRKEQATCYRK